jgi:hypothetical protein
MSSSLPCVKVNFGASGIGQPRFVKLLRKSGQDPQYRPFQTRFLDVNPPSGPLLPSYELQRVIVEYGRDQMTALPLKVFRKTTVKKSEVLSDLKKFRFYSAVSDLRIG